MPLTGLVQTTTGARGATPFRPNQTQLAQTLGDKETGGVVTHPTLVLLMASKSKDESGSWGMARKFLSVRQERRGGLHAPEEIPVSQRAEMWIWWYCEKLQIDG